MRSGSSLPSVARGLGLQQMLWCMGAKLGLLYYGKKHRLTVFENRAWRKICRPKLVEVTGWKNCIMSVIICTVTKFYIGDHLK
jgi:hypothetical protein